MTLIDTTLALLIAAIVSAYAVPAYREYLARGHRQEAVQALRECALQLEAGDGAPPSQPQLPHGAGAGSTGSEACRSTAAYRISVRGAGRNEAMGIGMTAGMTAGATGGTAAGAGAGAMEDFAAYAIEAAPQPRGPQRTDRCGVFTLDALGRQGNRRTGASYDQTFEGCWSGMRR